MSEGEIKREKGGESWRREVNEKFIRLQVPKALLSLPGVLSFKLLGRGGGAVPRDWHTQKQTPTHTQQGEERCQMRRYRRIGVKLKEESTEKQ